MKRTRIVGFLIILCSTLLLVACSDSEPTTTVSTNETGTSDEVPEDAVRITVSLDEGQQFINEQEVQIESGANLLEVMDETFFIETNEEQEIITIERQGSEEEDTTWNLYINDEPSDTLAKDYTITGGEKIVFDLHK
jgi:hypothetical protein